MLRELADAVRTRRVSARELVERSLSRIEHHDPGLNAVVALRAPQALAEAAALDERAARGEDLGPLGGVPFLVKDIEDLTGLPTTYGSLLFRDAPPAIRDGLIPSRLRSAGAVPIGATLPEAVSLLQRGGMDCMWGVFEWLKTFGYGDFAKNVVDYPLGITGPAIGLMMNRDAWLKFTPDQKKLHLRQAAYVGAEMGLGNFVIKNEATLKEVMQTKNVVFTPTEKKGFDDLVADYKKIELERNIKNAKDFGVKDPGPILAAYAANLEKWKKLSPGIGRDIKKFEEAMWNEVYSKVDPSKL